jgi:hypothetical protein
VDCLDGHPDLFGLFAVSARLLCYAAQARSPLRTLGLAGSRALDGAWSVPAKVGPVGGQEALERLE